MFQDGFGTRVATIDPENGDPVEVLTFAPALAAAPAFGAAVGERAARLARVRHASYARVRRLERPGGDRLLLYADHVTGWRLSELLERVAHEQWAVDVSAVLALLRQLLPAVALFSRHQRDAAIGTIAPERLIVTPQARLVIAEYVLAPGLEALQLRRDRLWRDFRVVLPHTAPSSRIPPAADVAAIGVVALSLLLGRRLIADEYLVSLGDLLDAVTESSGGERRSLSPGFHAWLARALQFDEHTAFSSIQEAQIAFEEMLARERSYVTTPAQLELLVSKYEGAAGAPPAVRLPAPAREFAPEAPSSKPSIASAPARAAGGKAGSDTSETANTTDPGVGGRDVTGGTGMPPGASAPAGPSMPGAPSVPGRRRILGLYKTYGVVALAIIAVIEAGVIVWLTRDDAAVGTGNGELVVQSRPVAARVAIDGEERGITPYSTELAPGPHVLEVRVGRSEPRVIPVLIRPGVQSGLYVELQSVATVGGLEVRSAPGKARVTVAGQYRGETPLVLKDLPPGEVEVLVQAGKREVRHKVRIEPGITSQLVVPLAQ